MRPSSKLRTRDSAATLPTIVSVARHVFFGGFVFKSSLKKTGGDGRTIFGDPPNSWRGRKAASQVVVHDEAVTLAMRAVVPAAARTFTYGGGPGFIERCVSGLFDLGPYSCFEDKVLEIRVESKYVCICTAQ